MKKAARLGLSASDAAQRADAAERTVADLKNQLDLAVAGANIELDKFKAEDKDKTERIKFLESRERHLQAKIDALEGKRVMLAQSVEHKIANHKDAINMYGGEIVITARPESSIYSWAGNDFIHLDCTVKLRFAASFLKPIIARLAGQDAGELESQRVGRKLALEQLASQTAAKDKLEAELTAYKAKVGDLVRALEAIKNVEIA